MAIVVRPAGYTGFLQRLVWAQGDNVPVTAYLWGGGGGGGGADSASGGNGGGAGYTQVNFVVNEGDIIEVAVGGKGTSGESGRGNAAGGEAGASFVSDFDFNIRTAVTSPPVFAQFNSAYCTFLNNNGVWVNPTSAAVFDRTWTVNFPTTGNYQFTMAADNFARCFVDGVEVFYSDNFTNPWTVGYEVPAGNRTIRILGDNTGGPGAVALTIVNSINGESFSGGRGGNSGPAGSSGAGGGGGGGTVIILNGVPIAAAAGGGGGGGGGNSGARTGESAPGPNGQAAPGDNAGQNGTNKAGDGGGGGGGGGGWGGGQGGTVPGGDQGGYAGSYGLSSGTVVADPIGRTPGGTSNQYWRNAGQGGTANGGNGTTGYAVFEFDVSGLFVHINGQFNPVNETYIKANGVWNQVKSAYIKQGGAWLPVNGSITPQFENVPNRFGVNPRSGAVETQGGGEVSGGGDSGGYDGGGGGGGGGKVICTALYELGYMEKEIFEHDQAYGLWLFQNDFVSYRGYRAWADVLVKLVKGQGRPVLTRLLFWKTYNEQQKISQQGWILLARIIGGAFSKEIARRAGHDVPFGLGGWLVVTVGLAVNKAIGYIVKKMKKTTTIDYKE
jgi:hypothetical protein